jgi:polyferredoxin
MDKMEYPRGLVRFTTENALSHKKVHVVRPRIFVYAALLLLIVSGTLWSMTHRTPMRADLIRDRNALYRELPGGMIENVYTLKLTNMDTSPHRYEFILPEDVDVQIDTSRPLDLMAEEVAGVSMRIRMPKSAGQGVQNLQLELQAEDDTSISRTIEAKVLLPVEFGG